MQQTIKEILTITGWTQAQLASEIGVDFTTINRWINGHNKPMKIFQEKLKQILKDKKNEKGR